MMPAPKFPQYKTVPTASLIPYARNARTHSPAQVDKIAAYGISDAVGTVLYWGNFGAGIMAFPLRSIAPR